MDTFKTINGSLHSLADSPLPRSDCRTLNPAVIPHEQLFMATILLATPLSSVIDLTLSVEVIVVPFHLATLFLHFFAIDLPPSHSRVQVQSWIP